MNVNSYQDVKLPIQMMKPFVNNVVQIITYITGLVIKFKQIIVKFHLKETLLMQAI